MRSQWLAMLVLSAWVAPAARAAEMNEHLLPLRPLLGKTWRGSLESRAPSSRSWTSSAGSWR